VPLQRRALRVAVQDGTTEPTNTEFDGPTGVQLHVVIHRGVGDHEFQHVGSEKPAGAGEGG
jgi:hypothetical protein